LNPNLPVTWTARGDAYFLLGRWDEALADLEQATRLDPSNKETQQLKTLAKSHVDDKIAEAKVKEAMPETNHVALPTPERVPEPAAVTPALPPIRADVPARPKPAPKTVSKAPVPLTAPPPAAPASPVESNAADYQVQGRKLIQEDKFAEAIKMLSEAVKLDPYLATAFNARGYCYSRLKQYKEALADFDEALKLNPAYGNAYTNRATALRAAGDKAGADADQAKARDLLKAK